MAGSPRANLPASVAAVLRTAIAEGSLAVGDRLAPEPELAAKYDVSRATMREALKELEREGLVSRRQRVGTTVSARPALAHPLQRNGSVRELIESSGRSHSVVSAELRFLGASAEVASALALAPGDPVVELARVRAADGTPVVLTIDSLDARVVETATAPLLAEVSFYSWLADHCGLEVTYGVARLTAALADVETARSLEVEEGTPLLRLLQGDFTSTGKVVLYSEELHVADAFDISVVRNGPFGAS